MQPCAIPTSDVDTGRYGEPRVEQVGSSREIERLAGSRRGGTRLREGSVVVAHAVALGAVVSDVEDDTGGGRWRRAWRTGRRNGGRRSRRGSERDAERAVRFVRAHEATGGRVVGDPERVGARGLGNVPRHAIAGRAPPSRDPACRQPGRRTTDYVLERHAVTAGGNCSRGSPGNRGGRTKEELVAARRDEDRYSGDASRGRPKHDIPVRATDDTVVLSAVEDDLVNPALDCKAKMVAPHDVEALGPFEDPEAQRV